MFNEQIIKEGSIRNVTSSDGAVIGVAFDTRIAYYRGLGLSMVEIPTVTIDGEEVPAQDLTFTYRGVSRSFEELAQVTDVRWELGEDATITMARPGGLAPGAHSMSVNQRLRVSYLPILSENLFTRTVVVG